ncbi:hypothetical protein [Glycomyces tritici]|uniref:Uncharacterized protein n=1 Tax=Glycomyces tritici TaxID=2665176 RepID=A0ABT7YV46_9ACTN|nr:hypothetical protein [Glycomyces tritici]MDN3242497.1 hypothetical protein [Glycomyces tritici]
MYTGFETLGRAADPPRNLAPGASTWFLLAACFLAWPAVFATVVIGTLLAAVIVLDGDPGGPLGWPIAWIASAIAYSLTVGVPLALCALQRRWYVRLIPALVIVVPIVWMITLVGVWALPGAAAIALSIALEATGARDRATMRLWAWLTGSRRR